MINLNMFKKEIKSLIKKINNNNKMAMKLTINNSKMFVNFRNLENAKKVQ